MGKVVLGFLGPILPARWRISRPERVAEVLVEAIAAAVPVAMSSNPLAWPDVAVLSGVEAA